MTDQDIMALVGPATYGQGRAAYERGDVVSVAFNNARTQIVSRVKGAGMTYTCWIDQTGTRIRDLNLTCACRTGTYCKHATAALWQARAQVVPQEPTWKSLLLPFLEEEADGTALALVLDASTRDVLLSPRRAGNGDRWVSHRASWKDLTTTRWESVTEGVRADHLALIRSIWNQSRRALTWHSPNSVPLASLGGQGFDLLMRARDMGITLLLEPGLKPLTLNRASHEFRFSYQAHDDGVDLSIMLTDGCNEYTRYALIDTTPPLALIGTSLVTVCASQSALEVAATHRRIDIPASDLTDFHLNYAPRLSRYVDVEETPLDGPFLVGQVRTVGDELDVTWLISYRSETSQTRQSVREALRRWPGNRHAIDSLLRRVSTYFAPLLPGVHSGGVDRLKADEVPQFLSLMAGAQAEIHNLEWDCDAPSANASITSEPVVIEVEALDVDDPDWFELNIRVRVGQVEIPLKDVFVAVAHGREWIRLGDGSWVKIDSQQYRQLLAILQDQSVTIDEDAPVRLPGRRVGVLNQLDDLGVQLSGGSRWVERYRNFIAEQPSIDLPVPRGVHLRDYQKAGVAWLLQVTAQGFGAILADDMGLGKTLQILALIATKKASGELNRGVLVCAPTSVVSTWVEEAARFYPDLSVALIDSTSKKRRESIAETCAAHDMIVTSWTLLRLDADEYAEQVFDGVVFDEAQAMKNPATRHNQVARSLRRAWAVAATGTPIENTVTDLWSIMNVVNPGLLPGLKRFNHQYRRPIETDGDHSALERLHALTEPFMRRRTKEVVARELPDKIEQTISVELEPAHRRAYERYLNDQRARMLNLLENPRENATSIVAALTKLRMLALDPALVDSDWPDEHSAKTQLLVDHLVSLTGRGHRALVFSQFTSYLKRVAQAVDDAGISFTYLDGTTRNREHVISRFRRGDASVFLISLKAGGTGLTLTEADYVYVMDPWWNPAVENQAVDRAHRIGQTHTVNVYRLCAAHTVEHKVMALQEHKRSIVDRVMTRTTQLSTEELTQLLT
ncbi:MAG: DEAD/DEAH box helicase [Actinomycetaceae bacterium]|nr:DEAD/DEAH box helicase [Actinomycetaceae bacterium]